MSQAAHEQLKKVAGDISSLDGSVDDLAEMLGEDDFHVKAFRRHVKELRTLALSAFRKNEKRILENPQ